MKTRFHFQTFISTVLALSGLTCGGLRLAAAPSPKAASANQGASLMAKTPKSFFKVPSSPAEGCDPFFPDSSRIFGRQAAAPKPSPKADVGALVLNGLSGTPDHRLAMINGHTLAEGEKTEINVPGGRVQIKCLEIKTGSVVIEVNGQRQELRLPKDLF